MAVLGGLAGVLASWLLFPAIFERGALVAALVVVLLAVTIALLVRAILRGGIR